MKGSSDLWIDDVYAAFGDCGPPDRGCSCPCCFFGLQQRRGVWGEAERAALRDRVMARLEDAELLPMTAALGHPEWLRHALPWLLEMLLSSSTPEVELTLRSAVLGALRDQQWRSWTAEQVDAVDRVLDFLWRRSAPPLGMERLLFDLSLVRDDVRPLLDGWLRRDDPVVDELLTDFVLSYAIPLAEGARPPHPCSAESARQITEWFCRDQTLSELEQRSARTDSEEARNASLACEHLRWIRAMLAHDRED